MTRNEEIVAEIHEEEMIDCALCGRRILFVDSYSPGDEAICASCDTEFTGRVHEEENA